MSNNLYNILNSFNKLTAKEETAIPKQTIAESVDPRGSVLEGVAKIEAKLQQQFAESEKWIQKAVDPKKKGDLHKALHVAQGEKIPKGKIEKASHSKNAHLRHMAQFAKNVAHEDVALDEAMSPLERYLNDVVTGDHKTDWATHQAGLKYKADQKAKRLAKRSGTTKQTDEQNMGPGTGGMEEDIASFGMGEEHTLDEKAPPGMEDMVMKLKKEYPGHPEKAFATAWSIYNKKHGKKSEGMEEAKHIGKYGTEYYKSDDFKGKDSDDYGTKEPKAKKPKQDRRGAPIKAASDRSDASLPWGGKPPKDTYKHQKGSFVHNVKDISRNPEADAAFARDEKIAKAKGHKKPASESKLAQRFNNIMEGRMIDESGETLEHILNRFRAEVKAFEKGGEIDRDLYDALYDYYVECGEMPYGVQKARTDDPLNWVCNKLDAKIGNLAYGRDPANAEGYGIEDEGIEGKFPHVSVPGKDTLLKTPVTPWEKAKAVAKDTAKGMMGHKDVEHFGTGHPQESVEPTMEAELNELAKLAGLKIADEGNAFTGKLAKTEKGDKFELDGKTYKDTSDLDEGTCPTCNAKPCACNEGNEFSGELAKAKAQHKDTFNVDGKEYPVKESITTLKDIASLAGIATEGKDYGDTDIEETPTYDNTPEEETYDEEVLLKGGDGEVAGQEKKMSKYGAARFSDNPMAMKKEVEEGVNPLDTLGRKLLKAYESIKIQK